MRKAFSRGLYAVSVPRRAVVRPGFNSTTQLFSRTEHQLQFVRLPHGMTHKKKRAKRVAKKKLIIKVTKQEEESKQRGVPLVQVQKEWLEREKAEDEVRRTNLLKRIAKNRARRQKRDARTGEIHDSSEDARGAKVTKGKNTGEVYIDSDEDDTVYADDDEEVLTKKDVKQQKKSAGSKGKPSPSSESSKPSSTHETNKPPFTTETPTSQIPSDSAPSVTPTASVADTRPVDEPIEQKEQDVTETTTPPPSVTTAEAEKVAEIQSIINPDYGEARAAKSGESVSGVVDDKGQAMRRVVKRHHQSKDETVSLVQALQKSVKAKKKR